jgi:hypothetical protein
MSSKPDRCATIGHAGIPATHEITWTQPGARNEPVTERVCAPCADAYTQRPALQAVVRAIPARQPATQPQRTRGRSR